jgi:hypothetical protein
MEAALMNLQPYHDCHEFLGVILEQLTKVLSASIPTCHDDVTNSVTHTENLLSQGSKMYGLFL